MESPASQEGGDPSVARQGGRVLGSELPIRLKSADGLATDKHDDAVTPHDQSPGSHRDSTANPSASAHADHRRSQGDDPNVQIQPAGRNATVEEDLDHAEDAGSAAATAALEGPDDAGPGQAEVGMHMAKKKKKSKSKSKMKKGLDQPSGFEDYYVDPPVTAEEYAYEQGLYRITEPFHRRIENAIQRYSERRKFDEVRRNVWVKYLRYGGIDTGPKMFGGLSSKDVRDIDEEEDGGDIQTLKAREFVSRDVYESLLDEADQAEDSKYEVDFDGVVSSFLSMHLPGALPMQTQDQIKLYTGVIRNWLNYLLHHNVCNEYKDQILAARVTCNKAETELWSASLLASALPEQFNEACRALYMLPTKVRDEDMSPWDDAWTVPSKMDHDLAKRVFVNALAALGPDTVTDRYMEQNGEGAVAIVQSLDTGIEIVSIEPPSTAVRAAYRHDSFHGLKPLGKVRARTWYLENEIMPDLTEEEEAGWAQKREKDRREYELWIDGETLDLMFVGLKMTVGLKELSIGIWFLDKVMHLFPSFALWLPNELMLGYREHEWIPPNREKILEKMGANGGGEADGGGQEDEVQNVEW